ncbi:MAG: 2,3-bisphosphoglycerate-dependent phosphoglycerate mutase [Candidatus Binatia bacterium]
MGDQVVSRAERRVANGGVLVLLRHGESEWNRERRFTGWTDVDLSPSGEAEAARAGARLLHDGFTFDRCFTSVLCRATRTAQIVLGVLGLEQIPVEQSWRLNERHYGALQGLATWPAMRRHGVRTVLGVRYRFAARPPALAAGDPRSPGRDPRYADVPPDDLPRGESHADTLARLTPYWNERIAPEIARGGRILVVSHKNTLRALAMLLERRAVPEMRKIRVPTGVPLVFVLDPGVDGRWQQVGAG